MKIVLATGGSLGHIKPAVLLGKNLKDLGHDVFITGALRGWEDYVKQQGIDVLPLTLEPLSVNFKSIVSLLKDILTLRKNFKETNVAIVVGFGCYASVPGVIAGSLIGVPVIIHEQNVVPGKANKFLKWFASRITVSFSDTLKYFPRKKVVFTGCPTNFSKEIKPLPAMYKHFGLNEHFKTIVVFGGSQGSKDVNKFFTDTAGRLKNELDFQVIHICGRDDISEIELKYKQHKINACVFSFTSDMLSVYAIADLVVGRGGAMTVTELAILRKRAVILPYPHAGKHQNANAEVLVNSGLAQIFNGTHLVEFAQVLKNQLTAPIKLEMVEDFIHKNFKTNATHNLTEEVLCAIA